MTRPAASALILAAVVTFAAAPATFGRGRARRSADRPHPVRLHEEPPGDEGPPAPDAWEPATACVGGSASGYPCSGMDLLARVPLSAFDGNGGAPSAASNLWGFVDKDDGREYAIIGLSNGTGVVDVTDPVSPVVVGTVPAPFASAWREVKVYQVWNTGENRWNAYAYVTTEADGTGLQILDLSDLPASVSELPAWHGIDTAHTLLVSNVDWATGASDNPSFPPYLYLDGSNLGGLRIVSLANPANPVEVGDWTGTYVHDVYTHVFADGRAAACAPGHDPCEVVFSFSGFAGLKVVDVTDKANPVTVSTFTYPQLGYTHSGWISRDGLSLFLFDELDEADFGSPTRIRTIGLGNLASPTLAAAYNGPTAAIDHNGYTVGDRLYYSSYTRGVVALDVTNPAAPVERAFFDTYPASDTTSFAGAWGVYPYLPSGTILVSDIQRGLVLVRESDSLASYDPDHGAPTCGTPTRACDSGNLLVGRGALGPEPNRPNTGGTCPDGGSGRFHVDESHDRLRIETLDGSILAPGKTVKATATVWAGSDPATDRLDLFYAPDAHDRQWAHVATLAPVARGAQSLETTFTLRAGEVQVLRARFRRGGTAAPCGRGLFDDHDDLLFAVAPPPPDATPPVAAVTAPAEGATVRGVVSVTATASDDVGVESVELLVDGVPRGRDATPPYTFAWDTLQGPSGAHTLVAKAVDAAGLQGESAPVALTVDNVSRLTATYDPALAAPKCAWAVAACDSGGLLRGRWRTEPHAPNTLGGSCEDGGALSSASRETVERIVVSTQAGGRLAGGGAARVAVTVTAQLPGQDVLEVYHAADATAPVWNLVATRAPTKTGTVVLQAPLDLAASPFQAVRARFRRGGPPGACGSGKQDDHDDLAFAAE